ncbi:Deoxyribose-phosphate aldolase [Gryllus bimaculatus]|nr:Deoxyribose-phosphate aldolase [Gryllus bimaculatus]
MSFTETNRGCNFDAAWLEKVPCINSNPIVQLVNSFIEKRLPLLKGKQRAAWLLRAITCIDLTTLAGDDTSSNVTRLCQKAAEPLPMDTVAALGLADSDLVIRTAAICVYPSRVTDAVEALNRMNLYPKIGVASVAAGFPSGQYSLKTRLEEIRGAVANGATEIDIVIDRSLVLTKQWKFLYDELKQMKEACGPHAHMKSILATGELGSLTNVYKASLVAMMAGSDFIKTSTGKETVNATLVVSYVMCRAIGDYYRQVGYKVGFKPAGGIRTANDALQYLILIKEQLGKEWLNADLFRIGASGLLLDIQKELHHFATGYYPKVNDYLFE